MRHVYVGVEVQNISEDTDFEFLSMSIMEFFVTRYAVNPEIVSAGKKYVDSVKAATERQNATVSYANNVFALESFRNKTDKDDGGENE
ncbi:hypothetical protein GCM10011332_32240 [Terasakiella brassicae]|uniref:Uncharacterized protein n=1 Tax=Terasakiella brassicae TaxID=1634917 RepID=A0A917FGN0_9PROT|nr:hypothetical protein [Terasakiella brassicae]GGF75784.1 hypothetical protein GCM10011332_32240 [Terasakiella brassicae]